MRNHVNETRKPRTALMIGAILSALTLTGLLSTGCDRVEQIAASHQSGASVENGQPSGKGLAQALPINYYRR